MKFVKSKKFIVLLIIFLVIVLTIPLTTDLYKKYENRKRNTTELSKLYELEEQLALPDWNTRRERYGCRIDSKGARHCDHDITFSGEGAVDLEPAIATLTQSGWQNSSNEPDTDGITELMNEDIVRFNTGSGTEKLCASITLPKEDSFGVYFWRVAIMGNDYGDCGE